MDNNEILSNEEIIGATDEIATVDGNTGSKAIITFVGGIAMGLFISHAARPAVRWVRSKINRFKSEKEHTRRSDIEDAQDIEFTEE